MSRWTPADLIALSDERELWLRRCHQSWREGLAHGEALHAADYDRGYAQAIADIKHVQTGLVAEFRKMAPPDRWKVRSSRRTRQAFGRPHAADYKGGPVQW